MLQYDKDRNTQNTFFVNHMDISWPQPKLFYLKKVRRTYMPHAALSSCIEFLGGCNAYLLPKGEIRTEHKWMNGL
jgi:hypothetical protein